MRRDLLCLEDLGTKGLSRVLELSRKERTEPLLGGRGVALYFEQPSARTRNAFEMAVFQLGGHPVSIRAEEVGIDTRETAEDVARTLASFHAVICGRVADHGTLERMASALERAGLQVPVVNLLSDREHPTQAVADLLTIEANLDRVAGVRLAYVGDANNVCRSLLAAGALAEMSVRVASPPGYGLGEGDISWARELGTDLELFDEPEGAVAGADVVYTDVWASMGRYDEAAARREAFAGFAVDGALLEKASPGAFVMHCLPAHRGEEISAAVLEGPRSLVWQQAANRMHAGRGILSYLLEESGG